jgi:hypothetical protein
LITTVGVNKCSRPTTPTTYSDAKLNQADRIALLSELLREVPIPTDLNPEVRLETLTEAIVLCTQEAFPPRARTQKDGWSPAVREITIALQKILLLKRHSFGHQGYRLWTPLITAKGLREVLRGWTNDLKKLRAGHEEDQPSSVVLPYPLEAWSGRSLQHIRDTCEKAYIATLALLQGKRRTDARKDFGSLMTKMEESRQAGRIGLACRVLMGSKRIQGFSLDGLSAEGVTYTDPLTVHTKMTTHFAEWYTAPTGPWAVPISSPGAHWTDLQVPWEEFRETLALKHIPDVPLRAIHTAMNSPKAARGSCLEASNCPTEKEFTAAILASKKDSAPGMSGLSYNMLRVAAKTTPDLITAIYSSLAELWKDKTIPDSWKWRWLVPTPKVPSPSLGDLRPLSLVEVLRKLWASVIMRNVSAAWAKNHTLNRNQHGFVPGRSMEEAVLEAMNSLESAKEWRTDLYISSWDIKRAFDRVPKQLLIYSWIRLGVPTDVAEYLVGIDMGGHTVVRTPHAQKVFWDSGLDGLLPLAFRAMLGAGQGTVDAPSNWNAVFDILLDALDNISSEYFVADVHGVSVEAYDMAAADDLLSACGTLKALRAKAEVVSAFCIVFGLDIATLKLRTFHVSWGNENCGLLQPTGKPYLDSNGKVDTRDYISIYQGNWVETRIPLASEGAMRYLGVHWDMNLSGQTIMTTTIDKLEAALARIQSFPCTADIKKTVLERCVFPSIVYQLKFANWPLRTFRELDKKISACIKRITGLYQTYPSELLYLSGKYGGHNFSKLSDVVHMAKLGILHRHQAHHTDSYSSAIISSLLGRVLRTGGVSVPPGEHAVLEHTEGDWWASSLVQWLAELDLSVNFVGTSRHPLSPTARDGVLDALNLKGVLTLACELPGNDLEVPLRVGQCWIIPWLDVSNDTPSVYEILSFECFDGISDPPAPRLHLLEWTGEGTLSLGSRVTLTESSRSGFHRGTRSTFSGTIDGFLQENRRSRCSIVTLSPETHCKDVSETWSRITSVEPKTMSPAFTRWGPDPPCPAMMTALYGANLYTDGSFCKMGSITDFMTGKETTQATGAVVETDDGATYGAVRLDFESTKLNPYLTELVTTTFALIRSAGNVASDCQGSLATMSLARAGKTPKGAQGYLASVHSRRTLREARWVKAHPEQDKTKTGCWVDDDFGIWLADGVAGGEMEIGTYGGKHIDSLVVLDGDSIIRRLATRSPNTVYIATQGGCGILLEPVLDLLGRKCFRTYCSTRDILRAPRPPKWADCTASWAAKMYRTSAGMSVMERATCVRIIYDKHLHGRNLAKFGAPPMDCVCKLCGGADSQYHIIRECSHPDMVACRRRHIALLWAKSNLMTSRRWGVAPYFAIYLTFALTTGEALGSHTAWTGILDPRLLEELEVAATVHSGRGEVIERGLIKECRGLAEGTRELHRIRHRVMQAMRGEATRALTKLTPHRRASRARRRDQAPHGPIDRFLVTQDSTQLQQARHSVWHDNHVITSAMTSQTLEPGPDPAMPENYGEPGPPGPGAGSPASTLVITGAKRSRDTPNIAPDTGGTTVMLLSDLSIYDDANVHSQVAGGSPPRREPTGIG